jgi:hypothetical protein
MRFRLPRPEPELRTRTSLKRRPRCARVPLSAQPDTAPYAPPVELEPHRADLLGLWADALDAKDLTAAERDEFGPAIWRAPAIAEDPSAYEDSDFALVKELERACVRWRSVSEPSPPGPTSAPPEPYTGRIRVDHCQRARRSARPGGQRLAASGRQKL